MTSIFEGQPLKTRPFHTKRRVIWVPGIYIYMCWFTCQPAHFKGTSKYQKNPTGQEGYRNSPQATEYEVDSLAIKQQPKQLRSLEGVIFGFPLAHKVDTLGAFGTLQT